MASSPVIPSKMRGWVRTHRGHYSSVLKLVDDLPTPAIPGPKSSDVLIRVTHVALEYVLASLTEILPSLPFARPMQLEIACSGTVVAAGGRAPEELRRPGTRVIGTATLATFMLRGEGVLKEYARLSPDMVSRLPDAGVGVHPVSLAEGVGLIAGGVTSLAMTRAAGIKTGQRVLINGASGSVGLMVVQLCVLLGAEVVGVASGRNEELVRKGGASEFVDYTKHTSLPDYLAKTYASRPFDNILDCVGSQALYTDSPRYLKPDGALINIGAMDGSMLSAMGHWFLNTLLPTWLGGTPRKYVMFSTPPDKGDIAKIIKLVNEGKLKVYLDSEWEMEDAIKAYDRSTSKRARGKVIIKVQPEVSD